NTTDVVEVLAADVTDPVEGVRVMEGFYKVIHMAAIPNPLIASEWEVLRVNTMSNWAVLEAAEKHGIYNIVMASSINAIGAAFSRNRVPRPYFPLDEQQGTLCQDSYAMSKWYGEIMADTFIRRNPGKMQIASMRFHWLGHKDEQLERKKAGGTNLTNPMRRNAMDFWGYSDIEESAAACRLAIEKEWDGHEAFFINATDTFLEVPTEEAIAMAYPEAEIRTPLPGFTSAISPAKAKRILGWEQQHSWRDL
ncbi:MAG: NAD(P)-dependent oxidoreductase, partial [Chloroflexi bacterium]|nr:NAD(P)-dependent oxidoreductase [Chloroflexota bacterium]